MKPANALLAVILCQAWLAPAPAFSLESEYLLLDGTRARVEKGKLVLIGADSKGRVAPAGSYPTRDGRYTIEVRGNEVVVRDHTQELR